MFAYINRIASLRNENASLRTTNEKLSLQLTEVNHDLDRTLEMLADERRRVRNLLERVKVVDKRE